MIGENCWLFGKPFARFLFLLRWMGGKLMVRQSGNPIKASHMPVVNKMELALVIDTINKEPDTIAQNKNRS